MSKDNGQLQEARYLITNRQLDEAYELLVTYLDKNPGDAQAWYLAAQAAPDDATSIDALERALEIQPDFMEAGVLLAGLKGDAEVVTYPTRPDDEED